jgi:hexulose-6-phosphate isomerase
MYSAINAWSVDKATGFADMFRQVKAAGFEAIELNIDKEGHSEHSLSLTMSDADLSIIATLSKLHKLPVCSISTSLTGDKLGSGKADDNAFMEQLLERQLYFAKTLGANGILTVPGGIGPDVSIAEAYQNARSRLESLRPLFDMYKLPVALENVWNYFFVSPYDMAAFIDSIGSQYISAYYDAGNTHAFSVPEHWVEILGQRITHVHVKGYRKANEEWTNCGGTFLDTLDCGIRWDRVFAALRQVGYKGPVAAEINKKNPEETYEAFYARIAGELRGYIT